ncbi:MAG: hypothetical protein Q4B14_00645 [Clostridia bacterium]|nr:hypothetical protein [Clostridia bacterium]
MSILENISRYGSCNILKQGMKRDSLKGLDTDNEFKDTGFTVQFSTNIKLEKAIIILGNETDFNVLGEIRSCKNITAVIDEENINAVKMLSLTNCKTINCGMALNNTLNVSGQDKESICISLQRKVESMKGKIIEPHDFLVTLRKPGSLYSTLISAAILLLSDIDSSKGYIF